MKNNNLPALYQPRKRRPLPFILAAALVLAAILSATALAAPHKAASYIGKSKAKEIALTHAGLTEREVTFIKAKLDRDDGVAVYDIEFYSGSTEYDYEINATTGAIREYDRDIEHHQISKTAAPASTVQQSAPAIVDTYIGEAKAKQIALAAAGLTESQVRKIKIELDRDHGRMTYEVDFKSGHMEYEYEIDALDGAILKSDVEHDD